MQAGNELGSELSAWFFAQSPTRRVYLRAILSPAPCPEPQPPRPSEPPLPPRASSLAAAHPLILVRCSANQHCWCLLCNTVVSIFWELRGRKVCLTSNSVCKKTICQRPGEIYLQFLHTLAGTPACLMTNSAFRHPGSRTWLHTRHKNALSHFRDWDHHFEV